jgi:hypothetical protein
MCAHPRRGDGLRVSPINRWGCAPGAERYKPRSVSVDLQPRRFAYRADDKAKGIAAIGVQWSMVINAGFDQLPAQCQNWRRAAGDDAGGGDAECRAGVRALQLGVDRRERGFGCQHGRLPFKGVAAMSQASASELSRGWWRLSGVELEGPLVFWTEPRDRAAP